MSTAITKTNQTPIQLARYRELEIRIALNSNLWGMPDDDVWTYYRQMCEYLGIDAVSHPFDVITDQKAQTKKLYPNSICTAQLGEKRKYSYSGLQITVNEDLVKLGFKVAHVSVTVTSPDGRTLVSEAFVDLMSGYEGQPLKGNNLVNALKKAGTQCRRRGTLQMAGLALPSDEIPTVKLGEIERAEGDADGVIIEHPPAAALLNAPIPVVEEQESDGVACSLPQWDKLTKTVQAAGKAGVMPENWKPKVETVVGSDDMRTLDDADIAKAISVIQGLVTAKQLASRSVGVA